MSKNRQLDLFVALIGDVPFRDEREAMSAPSWPFRRTSAPGLNGKAPAGNAF